MSFTEENTLSTDEFFKDTFAIDDYLSKCTQKSDLLTLRRDLKNYGQELYASMVDILKMETEDIINLAESLTNLKSKIDDLSAPVAQLCEEIKALYNIINDAKVCFEKHLNIIQSIHSETDKLNLKMGIINSSVYINNIIKSWEQEDITVLERAVNEYSFQYLYLNELGLESVLIDEAVKDTINQLVELINKVFIKAIQNKNEELILRSLRMHANLGIQKEAENCLKEKIVRPKLSQIFRQSILDENNQHIKILYDQALSILNEDMKLLLTVLNKNSDLSGFNFVINSFWTEVDKQLRDSLPNITAPGNPELFQRRFKDTWEFLHQIINTTRDPNLFRTDPSFQSHMKRFNLAVYFEIRFQQIAAAFEEEMLFDSLNFKYSAKPPGEMFYLKISSALWDSVQRCFHEEVFITLLCDQILKLMMLLISRYLKWYESQVKVWKSNKEENLHTVEQFIICALVDAEVLKRLLSAPVKDLNEFDNTVFKIIPYKLRQPLVSILKMNGDSFDSLSKLLQDQFVAFKVEHSVVHLHHVSAIPRLYRRTNRTIPKEPSNYVIEAVLPITKIHTNYSEILSDRIIHIMDHIIAKLSEQFMSLVQEVLRSVCKTEESLRRLKSRNVSSSDDHSGKDATSDEAKIREQIKLDVEYFVKELQPFSLSTSKNPLKALLDELLGRAGKD